MCARPYLQFTILNHGGWLPSSDRPTLQQVIFMVSGMAKCGSWGHLWPLANFFCGPDSNSHHAVQSAQICSVLATPYIAAMSHTKWPPNMCCNVEILAHSLEHLGHLWVCYYKLRALCLIQLLQTLLLK